MILLISLVTLIITFLTSLVGIGSAILFNPVMLWIGFSLRNDIIPAGLLLSMMSAGYLSWKHYRHAPAEIKSSIPFLITALLGAASGAYFSSLLSNYWLLGLFTILIIGVGVWMLFPEHTQEQDKKQPCCTKGLRTFLGALAGFGMGLIAGLTGVAGGFLILPILLRLGFSTKSAAGIAALSALTAAAVGFGMQFQINLVNFQMLEISAIAGIIGIRLGFHLGESLPKQPKGLKQVLGGILMLLGIVFLLSYFT